MAGHPRRAPGRPAVRLLLLGGLLAAAARALLPTPADPGASASSGALDAVARTGGAPSSDDEVLARVGADAVAADDPVVRARLLKLARYLELGGTAEDSDGELVASASALGLGRDDVVLRRYLAEAARLALAQPARADLPDEDELHAYYERNAARFTTPPRLRATQVYLSRTRRGAALADDAARLLEDLRARGVTPDAVAALGDPFVRGGTIDGPRDAIARSFGADFAAAIETLPEGGWQGPLASAYGLHLVWIERRTPARLEPFEQVRGKVVHALLRERGEERARARLAALRCHYGTRPGCAG